MKGRFLIPFLLLFCNTVKADNRDSLFVYSLPDSVKAIQFVTTFTIGESLKKKHTLAGISTHQVQFYFDNYYKTKKIRFHPIGTARRVVSGEGVYKDLKYGYYNFAYQWQENTAYQLMISMASDSASGTTLYSGYVFLPELKKWKLIGTYQFTGYTPSIIKPAAFLKTGKKFNSNVQYSNTWVQRGNGSWKNLGGADIISPQISLTGHADSVIQHQKDISDIESAIKTGKTDVHQNELSVYYVIMQQGSGKQVALTDTVTVHYKGSLFSDGSVFDQTKEKPARYPLQRLIRGWQIGVPLLKVGGKIKLVIPSDLAYSIRTRSAKIPPNSILVFEIEVLDARSPEK